MAATVRVLRSTDSGAPTLTGTVGSLITLLDAVLVNGFGSSTPLGWTKAFSGTNKAAYKNSAVEGTGLYLRVQDDATGFTANKAQTTGYEAMTTVDAGTNQFPNTNPTYYGVLKSSTADATNRPWVVVGTEYGFHLLIQEGTIAGDWTPYYFGDIISYKTSDPWKFTIQSAYQSTQGWVNTSATVSTLQATIAALSNAVIARDHLASVGATLIGKHTDNAKSQCTTIGGSGGSVMQYPAPVNNGVFLAPVWVHHGATPNFVVRGHVPGLWCPLHTKPLANNDTFSGTGAMAGKTFEVFNGYNSGQLCLETSNSWS